MIIANSALPASLAICHLISHAHSWNIIVSENRQIVFWWRHAVSYQNITTQKVLQQKKHIGSSVTDRNKLKRVVKACSRFYAMHFVIAYQARITQRKLELSMWINVFWLLNQVCVDIIWRTSFHIYKTIHNI